MPTSRVRTLLKRDGDSCHWCGIQLAVDGPPAAWDRLTVDHLNPRSQGGANAQTNLVLACRRCNNRRGTTPIPEWLASTYLANRRREVRHSQRDSAAGRS